MIFTFSHNMRKTRISFQRIPIDLVLCLLGSVILVPLAFFNIENPVRLILGLPFILFIPGYVLVFTFFPFKQSENSISVIERIALSLGISVAIVPLFGLVLNFSPWGIRLEPLLLILCLYIFSVGSIGLYRWYKITPEERFSYTLDVSLPTFKNRSDKILTIALGILLIVALVLTIYVIIVPRGGEKFTEFYVLGPNGKAEGYPQNLSVDENASVILGVSNHEYRPIMYTIEVWLVNETTLFNASRITNDTIVNHMWFIDEITIELNHTQLNFDTPWEPQWEYNYSFSIAQQGNFKLEFLLFTTSSGSFSKNIDYKDMAEQIRTSAYRELHLWLTVS